MEMQVVVAVKLFGSSDRGKLYRYETVGYVLHMHLLRVSLTAMFASIHTYFATTPRRYRSTSSTRGILYAMAAVSVVRSRYCKPIEMAEWID